MLNAESSTNAGSVAGQGGGALLWSVQEAAYQLGGVSVRSVMRLIETGALPVCRVGRLVRVPADAVREYVARTTQGKYNVPCVESGTLRSTSSWSTDAKIPRSTGGVSPTQAARELDALLAQLSDERRKRSKRNGS
ncbi:MAG: helix-turn-helix domain-containing protein [Proteobacteria bacterium]|nr:helix-turn-helix domain-containing protein [Pseudomonadota bacterium]